MNRWHSAGLVVYYEQDGFIEYLLLHYPAGHWDFPKGRIEEGELVAEAAARELMEETGLDAIIDEGFQKDITYFFIDHDGERVSKKVTFLIGRVVDKTVELSHEHIDFVWLPFEKAQSRITYDNAREVLEEAHAHILDTIEFDADQIDY